MIAVVQRCSSGRVCVSGEEVGALGARGGLLVLLGVEVGDASAQAQRMAEKLCKLRIFDDAAGKMNLAVSDVGGSILLISQFTLAGDCSGGNRPSFITAQRPEAAEPLIHEVVQHIVQAAIPVATGRFRTTMEVSMVNDGPVTLIVRVA